MKLDLCDFPREIKKDEIKTNLEPMRRVFSKYGVKLAYLYGSTLSCEESRLKDMDIGILHDGTRDSFDLYLDVYYELCKIFRADNIDITILNEVSTVFRYEVAATGEPIFCPAEEDLYQFVEEALFDYEDTRRFREEKRQGLYEIIKEGFIMARRKLNKERMDIYFYNIKESLKSIQEKLKGINNYEEFVSEQNKDERELCVHYLRIALEAVLDIARHIIAVKGFKITELNSTQLLDILAENAVLPQNFSQKIRGMPGMRNAIVHVYWNLNYQKLYQMITENISDFEEFARYILEYMEKDP